MKRRWRAGKNGSVKSVRRADNTHKVGLDELDGQRRLPDTWAVVSKVGRERGERKGRGVKAHTTTSNNN